MQVRLNVALGAQTILCTGGYKDVTHIKWFDLFFLFCKLKT